MPNPPKRRRNAGQAALTRAANAGQAALTRADLIQEIERRRESKVICLFTSDRQNVVGQIAKDFLPRLFAHFTRDHVERLDVVLFTLGGDTLAAYALNRFLRQMASEIRVLIPHWCHSAGTLFSLGANELVMTKLASLSAIDPSIIGPLNPIVEPMPGVRQAIPVGVESIAGFRNVVREDWRLGDDGAATAFSILAEKVNPLLLGDAYRSREQIISLATTLLNLHAPEPDKTKKIVQTLAKGLGSHDYLVTRDEARELGLPVAEDNADLEELIWRLYEDFAREMQLGVAFDPSLLIQRAARDGAAFPLQETVKIVILESGDRKDVWEREFLISPPPMQPQIVWNSWR
jgi:hypothetical protein